MAELTQEELNGLSSRARKAHRQSNDMIHETLTTNPRDEVVEDESTEKEKKEDEKL